MRAHPSPATYNLGTNTPPLASGMRAARIVPRNLRVFRPQLLYSSYGRSTADVPGIPG